MSIKTTLKNGQQLIVREATHEDASRLLHLKQAYIKNATTIPLEAEEYNFTVGEEEQVISSYQNQSNSILLLAFVDDQLVGNIDLTGSQRIRMRHTGMIGMGIHENFWNLGIATILMEKVLAWAIENQELELLWLEVYANNEAGVRLYENMGFKAIGKVPNFFKHGTEYYDKIHMYRDV